MVQTAEQNRENKTVFDELRRYVAFNVLGMAGLSCYILADTFFVSFGLGADGLTALNLAIPVYSLIHGCALMLGMGGATKYAVFRGQRAFKNAERVFMNTVLAAAVSAIFFAAAGLLCSKTLAGLLGADDTIFAMTEIYLRVLLLFSPAFIFNEVLLCFVRNDGGPRLAMAAMLCGSLSNIVLDYMFIFPLHMGIFGAVLATGFSPVIGMAILSRHWQQEACGLNFRLQKPELLLTLQTLALGLPSLVTEVASGVVMIIFNFLILGLEGNIGVAAYGIIANLSLVVTAVYTGMAQGMQPVLSRSYGRGSRGEMRQILYETWKMMLIVSCAIYLALFLLAEPITAGFNKEGNPCLRELAVPGLKLYFTALPFAGFNIILSAFFTSAEQAAPAQMISVLRGIVLIIPAAFLLAAAAGMTGVWLALPAVEAAVCLLGGMYYLQNR